MHMVLRNRIIVALNPFPLDYKSPRILFRKFYWYTEVFIGNFFFEMLNSIDVFIDVVV